MGSVFCPTCGNLLLVESANGENLYACSTCPYVYYIDRKITKSIPLKRKEVEPVLGGEEQWKNAARTDARCPQENCGHHQAYFKEIQIRSADEPATLFFRCAKCGSNWPRSQQEERTHQKAVDALHQLEVLKRERAAAQQLRAELEARTAAMDNLQQQLAQVESMRAADAEAAAARFREFEQALLLAERSMDGAPGGDGAQALELEAALASKELELAAARQQAQQLQQRLQAAEQAATAAAAQQGGSAQEVASLRRQLQDAESVVAEAAAAAQAAESERAALAEQVQLLQEQGELLRRQAQKRDTEAALLQRELEGARAESASATQRLAQLRAAVAAEAAATTEVLDKAEAAQRMLGEQLLALMQSRLEEAAATTNGAAAGAEGGEQPSFLTESDANALLDELEFLQQQLGKQQRVMEDAARRAAAAEVEAGELRERMLSSAASATAAPRPAVAAMYNSDLERQFAAATAIAAAAEAEAEALAVQNSALQAEVAHLRDQAAAAAAAAASAAKGVGAAGGGASASQLAAALERVSALERQNAELRDAAASKDAVLAESRKFIQGYLSRSSAAAEQRQSTLRGPAPAGGAPAAADGPQAAAPAAPQAEHATAEGASV